MKWRNHVDVTTQVADALGLSEHLTRILVEASLDPDRNAAKSASREKGGTRLRRIPHHSAGRREMMRLVWKARTAHLEGREEDAVWCLGRALHYVQDMHVRVGLAYWRHDRAEREIGHLHLNPLPACKGVRMSLSSPHFVWDCLGACRPRREPADALYFACLYSGAVAGAVLGDLRPEKASMRRWQSSKRRHWVLIVPAGVGMASAFVLLAFAGGSPHLSVLGPPAAALIIALDRRYYFDAEEAEWFGLR